MNILAIDTSSVYASSAIMRDELLTPEAAIEKISAITREDIVNAAKGISLSAVYKLMPKGECE